MVSAFFKTSEISRNGIGLLGSSEPLPTSGGVTYYRYPGQGYSTDCHDHEIK